MNVAPVRSPRMTLLDLSVHTLQPPVTVSPLFQPESGVVRRLGTLGGLELRQPKAHSLISHYISFSQYNIYSICHHLARHFNVKLYRSSQLDPSVTENMLMTIGGHMCRWRVMQEPIGGLSNGPILEPPYSHCPQTGHILGL